MIQNTLKRNLTKIIESIETERLKYSSHQIIKLIAVSKYVDINDIVNLYNIGQRAFGENKVQDLETKIISSNKLPLEWHFIGTLQENKINKLIELNPFMFQALDSIKLANALDSRLQKHNKKLSCLLEINTSLEDNKSGFKIEEALQAYEIIQKNNKNIILKGIMTIGPNTNNKKLIESSFKNAKDIFDKLQNNGAKILSCGMSNDYKIAIANGANMLRIGNSIFKI